MSERRRVDLVLDWGAEQRSRVIFLELACRDLMLDLHQPDGRQQCPRCAEDWPCRELTGYEP